MPAAGEDPGRKPRLGEKRRASGRDERAAREGRKRGTNRNRTPLLSALPPDEDGVP